MEQHKEYKIMELGRIIKRETIKKVSSVLQGETVDSICGAEDFMQNLAAYVECQREERRAARASEAAIRSLGAGRGMKLPAHVIDATLGWSLERWRDEYLAVVYERSALSRKVREYVFQLGNQAWHLTTARRVVAKYPELEDELIPKKN